MGSCRLQLDLCNKAYPYIQTRGKRSPWFVSAEKLAEYIDRKKREAQQDWERVRA